MRPRLIACVLTLALSWTAGSFAVAAEDVSHTLAAEQAELPLTGGLSVSDVSSWGRRPINTDRVVALMINNTLGEPMPGDLLDAADTTTSNTPRWAEVHAELDGTIDLPRGSYVLVRVLSETQRVMMLKAKGHAMVYVNGEPRMGDPYAHGVTQIPVLLHAGMNQLLFAHAGRGPMSAKLVAPPKPVFISMDDMTRPTIAAEDRDHAAGLLAGVVVINASQTAQTLHLSSPVDGQAQGPTSSFELPPCSVIKAPVRLFCTGDEKAKQLPAVIVLRNNETELDRAQLMINRTNINEVSIGTFESAIDASVQYFAVREPASQSQGVKPALVLSLHGASVEATNQAAAYSSKPDMYIVCPTNRRPFGFDWEDWGRLDALEVLAHASRRFDTDPTRQYLTGHSMGGHGTWQLGVLHPDRFAAIAPSAGWLSFDTYAAARAGESPQAAEPPIRVFQSAASSSDTIAKLDRLRDHGISILHGDADDNVPVSEARRAKDELTTLKIPFDYHEQPGAGHWWDLDAHMKHAPYTGAACVDWPPFFELFAKSTLKAPAPRDPVGTPVHPVAWSAENESTQTSAHLGTGSFKNAFNNRFVLVYGTAGSTQENAWAFAKARFDGEQWWYRGNGTARLYSDRQYLDLVAHHRESDPPLGNVILYGNLNTNIAAKELLKGAVMRVYSGELWAHGRILRGPDLATLQLHRVQRNGILVALVGGTGIQGMRATDRIPYFLAGVGIPDLVILNAATWTKGTSGVMMAGTLDKADGSPTIVWGSLKSQSLNNDKLPVGP